MLKPRILPQCQRWRLQSFLQIARSYATETNVVPAAAAATETLLSQSFTAPPPIVEADAANMRTYKPRTPGLRHLKRPINDHLWKGRAYLPLTYPRKGHGIGGRNFSGRITVRHRGGGHKRRIRIVDFTRMEGGKHLVDRIEHDPGRSAHIALITHMETGKKSYILAAEGMREGDVVQSYRQGIPDDLIQALGGVKDQAMIAAKTAWRGNCLPLHMIPPGSLVFNVGLRPKTGGQLCRGAGTFATVVGDSGDAHPKYANFVNVKLQSGEVRRIHRDACATIGVASNGNHNRAQLGKAGRSRWLGIRPTVRGVAMNAFEHPHGGGRGKSKGNRHPVSIWGRTPVSVQSVKQSLNLTESIG
jgi:ribosomal protein L2